MVETLAPPQATRAPAEKFVLREVVEELRRRGLTDEAADIRAFGPQTDDELWQAVYELSRYRIPRVAVCEGHTAPFDTFADLYFERVTDVLWIGNRGGGKTTNSGFLHGAKSYWKPGYKTAIAGAIEKQSDRAYAEFKRFIKNIIHMIVDEEPLKKKTEWVHGSENEVLAGTIAGVNGPHPHLAQFDELELIRSLEVFDEWLNMSQGTPEYDGQNLLTSTRKRSYGLVQALVKESEEAIRQGDTPPWDVRIFCVFETMAKVPECGVENPDGTLACGCDKVIKGKWPSQQEGVEGPPRTFASVCDGRAARADGFMQLKDVHRRFRSLGRRVWEAQQECLRPSSEGLVHEWWDPALYELPFWYPRPEIGPIYRSWDWGGTHPHAVLFHQELRHDVELKVGDQTRVIPQRSIVTFDEIFHPGGGAYNLGLEVFERVEEWHKHGFTFEVDYDFVDPANVTARQDVKRAAHNGGYAEPSFRAVPATVENSVDKHVEWGEDGKLFVVGKMCPNLVEGYEEYHWPEQKQGQPAPKKPVMVDDDAVDSKRYFIWNLYMLQRREQTYQTEAPASDRSPHPPQAQQQEKHAQAERGKVFGQSAPVASSMSPAYTRDTPFADAPTVRGFRVPSITQPPRPGSGGPHGR